MVPRRVMLSMLFFFAFGWHVAGWAADEVTAPAEVPALEDSDEYYELFSVLADTLDQVERNYVQEVSRRELIEAAIEGVITKLDPYSNYISPKELDRFRTSVESEFGGIGIQIAPDRDGIQVVTPIVGSPAYEAGMQAGDVIVAIEGESAEGLQTDEAVRRLKGAPGTKVTLTVRHPGNRAEEEITLRRRVIQLDTVMGDERKGDDSWDFMLDHEHRIGYVRLSGFSRETARDLRRALNELEREDMQGLILDLRFNPGGLLTSAIEICDMFISEGRIVSTEGRNSPARAWDAHAEGTYTGFPMAVLVNRASASASEIVSACLQDHDRAVVIGERTWGKGSVQNVIELEEGRSALKLTTASYQRPSGKNIHKFPDAKDSDEWGVSPNDGYKMRLPDDELLALMTYRRDRDILDVNHSVPQERQPKSADARRPRESDPEASSPEAEKDDVEKSEVEQPKVDVETPDTETPEAGEPESEDRPRNRRARGGAAARRPEAPEDFVDRQLAKAVEYIVGQLETE